MPACMLLEMARPPCEQFCWLGMVSSVCAVPAHLLPAGQAQACGSGSPPTGPPAVRNCDTQEQLHRAASAAGRQALRLVRGQVGVNGRAQHERLSSNARLLSVALSELHWQLLWCCLRPAKNP